jgi:hypothetical protein
MFADGFSKTSSVKVLKNLGKGGEGIAQLVDHPRFGRVVRKTYNITGKLFSKPLFDKKLEILKKVKSPYLPKFYGQEGKKPVTFQEYVKSTNEHRNKTPERDGVINALNKSVKRTTGVGVKDLSSDNLVRDQKGHLKAIDFLIDDPKLRATSRRGQVKNMLKAKGRPAMGRLLGSFDREAIRKKSRKEIFHNANDLSAPERAKLTEKATKPE